MKLVSATPGMPGDIWREIRFDEYEDEHLQLEKLMLEARSIDRSEYEFLALYTPPVSALSNGFGIILVEGVPIRKLKAWDPLNRKTLIGFGFLARKLEMT